MIGWRGMDPVGTRCTDSAESQAERRDARSPAQFSLLDWEQVAARAWRESTDDNIGLVAAGVAFYAFLALVPLLGATVLSYGLIAAPQTVLANVKSLTDVMPAETAKLVGEQLMSVVRTSGSKKGWGLLLALAIALFGARNAAGSVITALNIAYEEVDRRGLIRLNMLALAITAAAVVLAITAMIAIAALGYVEKLLPNVPGTFLVAGKVASYLLLLAGATAGAATLYRYGPDRKKAKWVWVTPGSIFASTGWIVLTLGFGFYAANFADYGKTYGSLATVVVLLTWVYMSAYVLLFGAELNSELEHQTAQDSTIGPAKPLGERGAWSADHVADNDHPIHKSCEDRPSVPMGDKPLARRRAPGPRHPYIMSWVAAKAGRLVGGTRIGTLSPVMATLGLSMLRRRDRKRIGAALVASAALIALLQRADP